MSQNDLIFVDTEFSSLNPYKGEILSIGMVKENGDELYLELEYNGLVDPWPKEHILPTLKQEKVSRKEAINLIKKFLGPKKPILVANANQFDVVYLYKLFGVKEFPFQWLVIDFASILFDRGYDPIAYTTRQKKFLNKIGIDPGKYTQHIAIDDARILREAYFKIKGKD